MFKLRYAPYSYSKLILFERCPHAWKLKYIDKIEEPQSPAQRIGEIAHKVVAAYLDLLLKNHYEENSELLEKVKKEYAETENLPEILEIPFANITAPVNPSVYGIEQWITIDRNAHPIENPEDENALLRGKIDFFYQTDYQKLTGEITIIDWKRNLPSNPDKKQIALYAILLAFQSGAEVFNIIFHSLSDGRRVQMKVCREELKPVWSWIINTIDKIETATEFPATPGFHCQWCNYLDLGLCPLSKKVPIPENPHKPLKSVSFPQIKPPQTSEEALKLAAFLRVIDAMREKVREALRPWCQKNGPVQVGDKAFGIWEKESITWKTTEAKELVVHKLLNSGIPREEVWNILSISKSALEKILKKHKKSELLPELLALGEKSKSSRLEWKSI